MTYFFDTSALVKIFSNESGSAKVKEFVINPKAECWISDLAFVELYSALFRKFRNNKITQQQLEVAASGIKEQLDTFIIFPLGKPTIEESINLIKEYGKVYGLRTLDALHISSWRLCSEKDWVFVSADKTQLKVVEQLNGKVINPQ